ncbi:MAG: PKD domain-containing protein [Mariniphaga sp.]
MKKLKFFFLLSIFSFYTWSSLNAQVHYCNNLSFELGDFTNWTGYTWVYSTDVPSANTPKVQVSLPTARRQVIMTDTTAYDPNTGNALRKIPSGYKYSARLGDAITSADGGNFRDWDQSLKYTMTVDSTNALLVMKFALVLQYASDHTALMEPRFKLTLLDEKGNTIPDCANYDVYSTSTTVKGFNSYTPSGAKDPIKWRDWTTVGANLLPYLGQTITLEFMAADCTGRFHYGYAYFVAECRPLNIVLSYCAGDSIAKLTAPVGFEKYYWKNSNGTVLDSTQILKVNNPTEGAVYSCNMTSATGCTVTLQSTINRYLISNDFSSAMIDCKSNFVQFTNLSTTNRGTLSYNWDFGEGGTSTDKNPQYKFATSGMHQVTLKLANEPSSCNSTLIKTIESFSPPLVGLKGDSTYCPGEDIYLKAYGAYRYVWNTHLTADSVKVGSPGGKIWMLGYSSTGCVSDTIYKSISEEPYWQFLSNSDTTLCTGTSTVLAALGAVKYLWNTKETTNTITVKTPGSYSVTGTNPRGCKKSLSVKVTEYPFPGTNFTFSPDQLSTRHYLLTCTLPSQTGVQYTWDMGDGSSPGTGATYQHSYTISNSILEYHINLTAKSKYDCEISISKTVDVVPFIPNVFSPNGDGINDVFMPAVSLRVYDRYGLMLYAGSEGWDGTYNGQYVDPDTYFYIVTYTDKTQQVMTLKGSVTVVK